LEGSMGIEIEQRTSKEKIDKLVSWIKEKIQDTGKKGAIFGLSGGIDSAVVAVLSKKAFPDNTMGLILPCESQLSDLQDAMKIIKRFNINYKQIDLTSIYHQLLSIMKSNEHKIAEANIKPRLRMIVLYYFANILDYLVVGTGNKSEISIGYFTKYGDGGVDILPLGNTYKSEVKEIAKIIEIPEEIISKPPSAGLWKDQTDEKEMGFSYELLDLFLASGELEDKSLENDISRMKQLSAHKRNTPSMPNF